VKISQIAGCAVFVILAPAAITASAAGQEDPARIVRDSTRMVIERVEEHKKLHGEKVTDQLVRDLIKTLEPVVDFHAFARAVMGKHAKDATEEQIRRFSLTFREALLNIYLKSFITFNIDEIIVHDLPPDFDPASGRATVRMQAAGTDGNSYQLRYSLRTDGSGNWKVRNFIVEGINVGLTFLNQFDGAMARHDYDVEKVIDNWKTEMVEPGGK